MPLPEHVIISGSLWHRLTGLHIGIACTMLTNITLHPGRGQQLFMSGALSAESLLYARPSSPKFSLPQSREWMLGL